MASGLMKVLLVVSVLLNVGLLVVLQSFASPHATDVSHSAHTPASLTAPRTAFAAPTLQPTKQAQTASRLATPSNIQAATSPGPFGASLPAPGLRASRGLIPTGQTGQMSQLVNPLLRHMTKHNADTLWDDLLDSHPKPQTAYVVEVGAHDGNQALDAGKHGFQVITYEPSPKSADGIRRNFAKHGNPKNVRLVQAAATNFTGKIMMNAVGSTGDHIGVNSGEINKNYLTNKHTEVEAQQVDDLIMSLPKGVYIVKIDVQGHEVLVLEGMRKALAAKKVLYVMLEFWPRAIHLTSHRAGWEALELLAEYGYTIFDTTIHHRRPRKNPAKQKVEDFERPVTPLKAVSNWYMDMDTQYGDTFGCKTDMLAVAPGVDVTFY